MADQPGRIDIFNRSYRHNQATPCQQSNEGRFFHEKLALPPGQYAVRVQIMFSEKCQGEQITIEIRNLPDALLLSQIQIIADPKRREVADEIYLSFEIQPSVKQIYHPNSDSVEIYGYAEKNFYNTLLRHITVIPVTESDWLRSDFFIPDSMSAHVSGIGLVFLGTTGRCNASCIHCPTNKPSRGRSSGYMSMELFHKIIDELASGGFTGTVVFGLFGEPLSDPLFIQRLQVLKERLPKSLISMSTNCGVFDAKEHGEMLEYIDVLSIHVESIEPNIYDEMMAPLKHDKVFPKIDELLAINERGKNRAIAITAPLHKKNMHSINMVRERFAASGRIHVNFSPLSSRCWDEGIFSELALAPTGTVCRPAILRDTAMIDWDGSLLPCCADFSKSMKLGNLATNTFAEIYNSEAWSRISETLRRGEWSSRSACSQCRHDHSPTIQKLAYDHIVRDHPTLLHYPATSLFVVHPSELQPDRKICFKHDHPDGVMIYGPYVQIPPGRYKLIHDLRVIHKIGDGGTIDIDVAFGYGTQIAASKRILLDHDPLDFSLEFVQNGQDVVEFRISKSGPIALLYGGVTLSLLFEMIDDK